MVRTTGGVRSPHSRRRLAAGLRLDVVVDLDHGCLVAKNRPSLDAGANPQTGWHRVLIPAPDEGSFLSSLACW